MILVNFKNLLAPKNILRSLMALVFISAGVFRILVPEVALKEMALLELPAFMTWLITILEIVAGICLLFPGRPARLAARVLIVFLISALIISLKVNSTVIWGQVSELFVFDATATDFFLHLVFLIILFSLLSKRKQ